MIDHYSFGSIRIDGRNYRRDVIILRDRVIDNWWRKSGHELHVADISDMIEKYLPEVLVVGTGSAGALRVMPETVEYLESKKIKLIEEKTGDACKTLDRIVHTKKVMGAFHLTC